MELLMVSWSQGGSYFQFLGEKKSFLDIWISKLISYYLNLKIFQHLSPPSSALFISENYPNELPTIYGIRIIPEATNVPTKTQIT